MKNTEYDDDERDFTEFVKSKKFGILFDNNVFYLITIYDFISSELNVFD